MITGVDLFCGVGGLTHGLAKSGVSMVAGIDIDPQCQYPYERNNQALFVKQDIKTLTADVIRNLWHDAPCKLLAGCAPCQPFSTYSRTKRRSERDGKWDLVAEFGRLVCEAGPDLVTMENVPQLCDHSVFSDFLAALHGYKVWYGVVECSLYGVPQTRRQAHCTADSSGRREGPCQPPGRRIARATRALLCAGA